jgi:DNA-binding CsgD family transcriptional regulator
MATVAAVHKRIRADLLRHAHRDLSVPEFCRAAMRTVGRAVPFDGTCVLTMDPATLLPTGEEVENGLPPETLVRLTEIEQREQDVNSFTALARAPVRAASLSEATEGDLDQSIRQRELRRPNGFDDELRAVLSDDRGTWGALTLLRAAGRPRFTPSEVHFVASLTGLLADGLRRAALIGDLAAGMDDTTGLLVLAPDNAIEMANRAAERWLDELDAGHFGTRLPTAVRSVAARTRRMAGDPSLERDDHASTGVARARVRTGDGHWVVVRGSLLGDGDGGTDEPRVAILLEEVRRPELAPLVADAYGFTERERRVTELVAQGFSTDEMADQLHLSAYTIQDHLKAIFEKSGASSRGDLVARIFFDHHVPRLGPPDESEPAGAATRSPR